MQAGELAEQSAVLFDQIGLALGSRVVEIGCGPMPRKTRTARFSRRMSSSAKRPTRVPILDFGTVVILSTINLQVVRRPLASLGSIRSRNKGASVGSVVNAPIVIEFVTS